MGIRSIDELKALFSRQGVETLYLKPLALNQDNEKNQIYLGGGLDGITNLFPGEITTRSASTSVHKRCVFVTAPVLPYERRVIPFLCQPQDIERGVTPALPREKNRRLFARRGAHKALKNLVVPAGVEPATFGLGN